MQKNRTGFLELINKVAIGYKGTVIPKNRVFAMEEQFLSEAFDNSNNHKTLIFQHTGSDCYDAVALTVISLGLIFLNNATTSELEKEIKNGDIVTYKSKRWIFSGITNIEGINRCVLKNDKGDTIYVHESNMCDVLQYNGKSKKLNGIGIGRNESRRTEFLKYVAELNGKEIAASSTQSVILYIDNRRFDELLNGISIKFENREYKILDLVTASFYTDNVEIKKRGNANNNEPMLKATFSIDKAEELVKKKQGNTVIGFVVFDDRVYKKYGMDLEGILYRKKLPFSIIITKLSMDKWIMSQIDNDDNIMVLALTSEYLKALKKSGDKLDKPFIVVSYEKIIDSFNKEIKDTIDSKATEHIIKSTFEDKDFNRTKSNIAYVMNECLDNQEVMEFCRWAYFMLKLFNNAIFTFKAYETFSEGFDELKDLAVPSAKIEDYKKTVVKYPMAVQNQIRLIIDYIESKYNLYWDENPKFSFFVRAIRKKINENILVVVPNNRYQLFIDRLFVWRKSVKYRVVTESQIKRIDLTQYTDIYYTSLMKTFKYNPFDNAFNKRIDIMIYDNQLKLYRFLKKEFTLYKKSLNERSYAPFFYVPDNSNYSDSYSSRENAEKVSDQVDEFEIDNKLQKSFMESFLQGERYLSQREYEESPRRQGYFLTAYKYAKFISGENAIFTKGYVAYVINPDKQCVEERPVDDLKEGDQLIFLVKDNNTKDIVDELLSEIVYKDAELERNYNLVRSWKIACREYKYDKGLKYTQISNLFRIKGYKVNAQVIRSWLDEESHIVGPKKKEAFIGIQEVFGKDIIPENYMDYANATKYIRSTRMKILKLLEKTIISDNIEFEDDMGILDGMKEIIEEIAIIKQIDHIETTDSFNIAGYRANRPIES
ncbi:hypothetical protein SAMN05216390_11722 [Lachnospiraceae bacterium KH1T2]|nr:hypothetical protein SAMN05216390_11722 [Lachnospiraceae bacterium KH1T2]